VNTNINPKYGDNIFLRNVGIYLGFHTALQAKRPTPVSSSQREH